MIRPGWVFGLAVAIAAVVGTAMAAEEWQVVRNVRLLSAPSSTTGFKIRTLQKGESVTRVGTSQSGDYIKVEDEEGQVGWVYKPFVIPAATEPTEPEVGTTAGPAEEVSSNWEKPEPNSSQFTKSTGEVCGPTGSGGDTETNRRKNRTDIPTAYHEVTFKAIDGLKYPVAGKHRSDWTADQLSEIAPYEGVAVTVTGYLAVIRSQKSNQEYCNCRWTGEANTDWHVAFVEHQNDGEETGFVVETTPRIRRSHPKWTVERLTPWVHGDPVRISGWLMLDPEHRNHLGTYRNTLWEIHPITRIEVMHNGAWLDLDQVPDPS